MDSFNFYSIQFDFNEMTKEVFSMDLKEITREIESELSNIFSDELTSGLAAREDSRAFGAMIEQKIADNWDQLCSNLGYSPLERPGKRTIFDFALQTNDRIFGIDVKTKDLDSTRYSDGGICAVGNLLKFLANDKGVFLIAEFGHNKLSNNSQKRDFVYIRVAPFIMFPSDAYRIENLGTGQIRLNYTVKQVWDEIEWNRNITEFYDMFIKLATQHYRRVSSDALSRIADLEAFKANGYKHFSFNRR